MCLGAKNLRGAKIGTQNPASKGIAMVSVKDVPPDRLIRALAQYLKENVPELKPPEWAFYTKTGCHAERVPQDPDWWYVRAASILRKLYLHGPVGVERLRAAYGGRADLGMKRKHVKKGGGSHIRKVIQQLEQAGLVAKLGNKGRVLTPKGRSLLDRVATRVFRSMLHEVPELRKYM